MDAPGHFDIDGMRPRHVERPTSFDAVASILAEAAASGTAIAPLGGAGALHIGNPIERYGVALDMRGLDRILEHQAADLVLSVEAGVCLSDISKALARHGQWLPIEAPDPDRATIGGLIATALSGPGRLGHGSLRDYLIGISVATPTGGLAKAGGMVVKNVSGFDLMRLHHGALGTLGVILSANFKVLPAPRGQASVSVRLAAVDDAKPALDAARGSGQQPSAVEVLGGVLGTTLTARFDGLPRQVEGIAAKLTEAIGGEASVLVEDESRAWWRTAVDQLALPFAGVVELRLGARPTDVMRLAADLEELVHSHDISTELLKIWPGLGSIIVRLDSSDARGAAGVDSVINLAEAKGVTWRMISAPPDLKSGRDVWGTAPASMETMRRLKEQFDPGRVLNPGRFCGLI